MRKIIIASVAMLISCTSAFAACYGSGSYKTCYDEQSGNSYSVQRYGGTTTVYGNNPRTGSTWSQQTYRSGNSSQTYGQDSDGNSWSKSCYGGSCY